MKMNSGMYTRQGCRKRNTRKFKNERQIIKSKKERKE